MINSYLFSITSNVATLYTGICRARKNVLFAVKLNKRSAEMDGNGYVVFCNSL